MADYDLDSLPELTDEDLNNLPDLSTPTQPANEKLSMFSELAGGGWEGVKGLITSPYDASKAVADAHTRILYSNDKFGQTLDETGKFANVMVEGAGQGLGAIAGSVVGGSGVMTGGGVGQTIARESLTGLKGLSDLLLGTDTFKDETDAQANKSGTQIANEMFRNIGQTGGGLGVGELASRLVKPASPQRAKDLRESATNSRLDAMDATNTQMAESALKTKNNADTFTQSDVQNATRLLADEGLFNSSNPKILNENLVNKQNQTITNISNIIDKTDQALPNGITLDRATLESQLKSKFAKENTIDPKKGAIYNSNIDNFLDGIFGNPEIEALQNRQFSLKDLDAKRQEFGKFFDEKDAVKTEVAKSFYQPLRDIIDNEVNNISPDLLSDLQSNNKVFESLIEVDPILRKYTAESRRGSFGDYLKKSLSHFGAGGSVGLASGLYSQSPALGVGMGIGTNLALEAVNTPRVRFAGANLKDSMVTGMPKTHNVIDKSIVPTVGLVQEQNSNELTNGLSQALGIPEAHAEEPTQEQPIDFNAPELQNVGQALGVNEPQVDYSQGISRNSADFTPEALNYIIQSSANTPASVVVNQLAQSYSFAEKSGDSGKKRKLLEDLSRIVPQYFEQGQGIDNRLSDPTSQADYMKMIYNKMLRGKLDPQIFAKQHQSFADNGDGTIIPLEKDNQNKIQIQSSNGTIDRLQNPLY